MERGWVRSTSRGTPTMTGTIGMVPAAPRAARLRLVCDTAALRGGSDRSAPVPGRSKVERNVTQTDFRIPRACGRCCGRGRPRSGAGPGKPGAGNKLRCVQACSRQREEAEAPVERPIRLLPSAATRRVRLFTSAATRRVPRRGGWHGTCNVWSHERDTGPVR